jgi:polyhydroxyalkanoate synthesis regulator phasin
MGEAFKNLTNDNSRAFMDLARTEMRSLYGASERELSKRHSDISQTLDRSLRTQTDTQTATLTPLREQLQELGR